MTIRHFTQEEIENLRNILPQRDWDIESNTNENKEFESLYDDDLSKEERAYAYYKSPEGQYFQEASQSRDMQQAMLQGQPLPEKIRGKTLPRRIKYIQSLDNLINKNTIPEGLENKPLYRGVRLSYGTSLIKSGKKPGDIIRDPRFQSFSLNPGTAMYHTSISQYGDLDSFLTTPEERDPTDPAMHFKRKKKVLLEHYPKAGETGLYGGSADSELEVIYPRNKTWTITNIRDEDVTFSVRGGEEPIIGKQNVRIYTVERKKKKIQPTIKRKIAKPKKKFSINLNGLNNLLIKPKKIKLFK